MPALAGASRPEADHRAPPGTYICAFQRNAEGDTAGWLRRDRLHSLPVDREPELGAWTGHWIDPDGSDDAITITREGQALAVVGYAYWPNADPPLDRYPGGPNLGELS